MLWQLILKDLKVFFSDRRALIISIMVPIAIASFMAMIFGNAGQSVQTKKFDLLVINNDDSDLSRKVVENLKLSPNLVITMSDEVAATKLVKDGQRAAALVLQKGFGTETMAALAGGKKPELTLLTDPAQNIAVQAIHGNIMEPVIKAAFGGGPEFSAPFEVIEKAQKADKETPEGGVPHVFAGMAVQGLLFFSIEAAMGVMRERRQGIWKRLRAAPVSPTMLLLARILSGAMRAMTILVAVFGFGILAFHMKVSGSWSGMILISLAAALMAATFGLFVAALGRNEQQSRGLAIFVVLTMTMLGGAWFPSFLMPEWVQKVAMAVPVKWAVDGFDSMTWRGGDLMASLPMVGALLVFAVVFGTIALTRFRWDAEAA